MKKLVSVMLVAAMTLAMIGCGAKVEETAPAQVEEAVDEAVATEAAEEVVEEVAEEVEEVVEAEEDSEMPTDPISYEEFMAIDVDTPVMVETYVQAKQSWWQNAATVYTQNEEGAYFLYNMECAADAYELLTPGTKIRVTGYKSEWAGEVEIVDAKFTILEGETFVAEAEDVTELLGTDELANHMNEFVSFKGLTVEPIGDGDAAFLYSWDGSGAQGDDLYFNVSYNGQTFNFTVESYLCDSSTEVYQAVENWNVGDVVDLEGFLYWYEGVNPHITSVVVK